MRIIALLAAGFVILFSSACQNGANSPVELQTDHALSMAVTPDTLSHVDPSSKSSTAVTTVIRFALPVAGNVRLAIYDVSSSPVSVLVDEYLEPGMYEVEFNASAMASGCYFVQLTEGSFRKITRMLLIK